MPSNAEPSIGTITEGGLVTQVGEGREADEATPPAEPVGAPSAGEVLAERYELSEHINDDSAGRQVWRGIDVVLRRPVAVVLRYPGGDSATEMLQAAVTASRVIHPNLVGVYDAIDEQDRAYVVREWVDGRSLRELVTRDGYLDAAHSTTIAHSVAGAVAAVHATGMVHGNIHPGTVMAGDDGRVVLADARADEADSRTTDVRAIGGVLYFALTGHWPHAEATLTGGTAGRGRAGLPDAVRDSSGGLTAPHQVRAGVPAYLDEFTMDLLDPTLDPPSSEVLAAELGRLDVANEDPYIEDSGPLRFADRADEVPEPPSGGRRKIALGVAGLLTVALVGLLIGINALTGGGNGNDTGGTSPAAQPGADATSGASAEPAGKPQPIQLAADQVRIVDPDGDRQELDGVDKVVDGDPDQGWKTAGYKDPLDKVKRGMGVLIDLKEPRTVSSVQVALSATGVTAELLTGPSAPDESSKAADNQIFSTFSSSRIGEKYEEYEATTMTFSGFDSDRKYQYLLFWITSLPESDDGRYRISVQEITVQGL